MTSKQNSAFLAILLPLAPLHAGAEPDRWTAPQPGWLYVIDHLASRSRLLLIEPEQGKVMGSLALGYSAEMSLSRNGAKLFVSFGDYESEPKTLRLAVIDTASGKIETSVENEGAMLWHLPPPVPNIAAAPDGSRVFILKRRTRAPGSDDYAVAPFDARTGRFLQEMPVPHCSSAALFALDEAKAVLACGGESRIIFLDAAGPPEAIGELDLPYPPGQSRHDGNGMIGEKLREVAVTPDGKSLLAIRTDGKLARIGIPERKLFELKDVSLSGRWMAGVAGTLLPQSSLMFVPCAPMPLGLDGKMLQMAVIDTGSNELLKMIRTSRPFWSATTSSDGKFIYALSPWSSAILVIDAKSFNEVRTLRAGSKPSQVLVAP